MTFALPMRSTAFPGPIPFVFQFQVSIFQGPCSKAFCSKFFNSEFPYSKARIPTFPIPDFLYVKVSFPKFLSSKFFNLPRQFQFRISLFQESLACSAFLFRVFTKKMQNRVDSPPCWFTKCWRGWGGEERKKTPARKGRESEKHS